MINIVIPLAGNLFFDAVEYSYPKPLIEIKGVPIIERVVKSLNSLPDPKRFIFITNKADDSRFHLQDTFRLITKGNCEVILLERPTKGAVCSVLMAIEKIKGNDPLIIANGDQIFNFELSAVVEDFKKKSMDAGVICFDSVHPRWAYVRLSNDGYVMEAAARKPISRHAIAGFYYFAKGDEYINLAMQNIEKGVEVENQFYVALVLNEYILQDKKVGIFQIENKKCQTFYSIQKIEEAQHETT